MRFRDCCGVSDFCCRGVPLTSSLPLVLLVLMPMHRAADLTFFKSEDVTKSPQRMWDPEEGRVLGQGIRKQGQNNNLTLATQTAVLGQPVFLRCPIRDLDEDVKVSWIRRRDYHLLTSGLHTYSSDGRFTVVSKTEDDWPLRIQFVQQRDEGQYECQVSTAGGQYGHLVELKVHVAEANVSGGTELHVQAGSTISLLCNIHGSLNTPEYILWAMGGRLLNYDQSRGGISIIETNSSSHLTITNAGHLDSGTYVCQAPNTRPAHVQVYVSHGDKTAAIQRYGSGSTALHDELVIPLISVLLYSLLLS